MRLASVQFTDAIQPKPLSLIEIQQQGLDHDTLILEFFLGDENSYLWVVSKDSICSYVLPARATIEDVANRVRSLLIAPAPVEGESFDDRQARLNKAEQQYWNEAATLSQMLLGKTTGTFGDKRLLVIPDGALQYIPFNALPVLGSVDNPRPLLVEHEISYESSASALVIMRNAPRNHTPSKAVAIFADPVFESDDSRLAAAGRTTEAQQNAQNDGFIYAGTSRVVASLWKVDDDATAELMKHFYQRMLQEKRSPAAALREAQLAMWQTRRWRAPYYWAAFVLQGEYAGTIDVRQRRSLTIWYLAAAIGLLVAGYVVFRRTHIRLRR